MNRVPPYVLVQESRPPRLPLQGSLDLTYRCNNNCLHCWLRLASKAPEQQQELSFDEITRVVDEARAMGCRRWAISGGEPMLREDFSEIFDYITSKSASYSLNTNGTLITPAIAQLMRRKGSKMVALYGATAEVHDRITRNPGSFEATLRGFAYLKEAGAGFVVQLIPMRDNYHQFNEMVSLAESLGPHSRIGASWLYLSASGSTGKNHEIAEQRLSPADVIELDQPNLSDEHAMREEMAGEQSESGACFPGNVDDRLFALCIANRRDFHVDPYGQMTFCCFIKDPALRYDLRTGTVQECWDKFIPGLAETVRGGTEYQENCGSCENRAGCRWCAVYGYLEHRRFSAPVQYLCAVARENRKFKEDWQVSHRRYYQIAGITIQVDSDLPITDQTFHPKFKLFEVEGPGDDMITIRHHFSLPEMDRSDMGREVYRKPPWAIYQKGNAWIYLGISPSPMDPTLHRVAVFNHDHTRARVYNQADREATVRQGNTGSLTLFATDQIWLARVLADRQGCFLHASGVILNGQGLLFVGHSEAGKSTITTMLKGKAEILCDDRIIVRRWREGFRIHGTWSHGDVPDVSSASAPLRAILFLEQSKENRLVPLDGTRDIFTRLVPCLIKPFVTADWWEKELVVLEQLAKETRGYTLRFDKSGAVVDLLETLR